MRILKNLKTISGETIDIYLQGQKIVAPFSEKQATKIHDFQKETFVSEGWIDIHTHCDVNNPLYYSHPDEIGYRQGVTMVIDGGSVGKDAIWNFYQTTKKNITNVKCFLNISKKGIFVQNELDDLKNIDINYHSHQLELSDFIVGYKIRLSHSVVRNNGIEPLKIFNQLKKEEKPLMVHIGNEPPFFDQIIKNLKSPAIITHVFNGKNNSLFSQDGQTTSALRLAQSKNIKFDLGHGSDSFNFVFAKKATNQGFKVNFISSDIYEKNMKNQKVVSLSRVMDKMYALNYQWSEIIKMVTSKPREYLKLQDYGKIKINNRANLTIFQIKKCHEEVTDSYQEKIILHEKIVPVAVVINGQYWEIGQSNDNPRKVNNQETN